MHCAAARDDDVAADPSAPPSCARSQDPRASIRSSLGIRPAAEKAAGLD